MSKIIIPLKASSSSLDPVPIRLFGEGNYAITDIKEVRVTKQFLELDDTTRGCHRNSEMDQCGTTTYLEKLRAQCGCIDNNLKRFFMAEEVSLEYFLEIV